MNQRIRTVLPATLQTTHTEPNTARRLRCGRALCITRNDANKKSKTHPSQNSKTIGSHRDTTSVNDSKGGANTEGGSTRTEGGRPNDHQHIHQPDGTKHHCHSAKDPPTEDT
jgi:hypothetical protein